jgi:hypothetical protein
MNEIPSEPPLDHVIDRIVDGSLEPGELRLALAQLEGETDGWKKCTLAFLEAQCWRDAFRGVEAPAASKPGSRPDAIRSARETFDRRNIGWWRSAAAAGIVAVAFALGWLSRVSDRVEPAGAVHPFSASALMVDKSNDSSSSRESVIPVSAAPPGPSRLERRSAADSSPEGPNHIVQAVGQVQFGPEGAGATVPILAGPGINVDWLNTQPPPLSESEQVLLQRHGYQVDQRRRLLVGTLADGRRVSVPIDQVEIRFTGIDPL